ncbi:hypothetical protein DV515_00002563 [Chloebia gouldiae]|uniref:Uncharacterized protein n=1 Tax=Chloebia gouldiae TaxID=44316 RepID=A0A3L8SUM7_CHLGU|nr:hypothetical protein DV515_00002563 [Chloebia gouldiae]
MQGYQKRLLVRHSWGYVYFPDSVLLKLIDPLSGLDSEPVAVFGFPSAGAKSYKPDMLQLWFSSGWAEPSPAMRKELCPGIYMEVMILLFRRKTMEKIKMLLLGILKVLSYDSLNVCHRKSSNTPKTGTMLSGVVANESYYYYYYHYYYYY